MGVDAQGDTVVVIKTGSSGTFTNMTLTGNLTVLGDIDFGDASTDTFTAHGVVTIDVTHAEAFLVRKDADAADVFSVNTTLSQTWIGPYTGPVDGLLCIERGGLGTNDEVFHIVAAGGTRFFITGEGVLRSSFANGSVPTYSLSTDNNTGYGFADASDTAIIISGAVETMRFKPTIITAKVDLSVTAFLNFGAPVSKTIATGAIAVTGSRATLVVEGGAGAGADALLTATGGSDGDVLILQATTSGASDTVTVTDGTGANTFIMTGGANFALNHIDDRIEFLHNGTEWVEQHRADNS